MAPGMHKNEGMIRTMLKHHNAEKRRETPLWWQYAVTYLLVLTIPFLAFNAYFNRYVTREAEKDIQEAMQSTLNKIQLDFDQKVEQIFHQTSE